MNEIICWKPRAHHSNRGFFQQRLYSPALLNVILNTSDRGHGHCNVVLALQVSAQGSYLWTRTVLGWYSMHTVCYGREDLVIHPSTTMVTPTHFASPSLDVAVELEEPKPTSVRHENALWGPSRHRTPYVGETLKRSFSSLVTTHPRTPTCCVVNEAAAAPCDCCRRVYNFAFASWAFRISSTSSSLVHKIQVSARLPTRCF